MKVITYQDHLYCLQREGIEFIHHHTDASVQLLFWLTVSYLLHHLLHDEKHYYLRQIAGTNLLTWNGWKDS